MSDMKDMVTDLNKTMENLETQDPESYRHILLTAAGVALQQGLSRSQVDHMFDLTMTDAEYNAALQSHEQSREEAQSNSGTIQKQKFSKKTPPESAFPTPDME